MSFFSAIEDPHSVVTAIQSGTTFPEVLEDKIDKYVPQIREFANIVLASTSSADVLARIRDKNLKIHKDQRMSFLKMFRRCVSPVCDTEATKKIQGIPTSIFIENYGHTFKPIERLKAQFQNIGEGELAALSALLGEYDNRGEQGYVLTDLFFTWFEEEFGDFSIDGPRRAGQDIQLSSVFEDYDGDFPCDFVIRESESSRILAIGFARYDSTRGGAQSDDRTGGNSDKVSKAMAFSEKSGSEFKIIFLSDGPGLTHGDTWTEACTLDGKWGGNVRVTTLKTLPQRVSRDWLLSD